MAVDVSSVAESLLRRVRMPHLFYSALAAVLASALLASVAEAATYDLRPESDISSSWNKVGAETASDALDDLVTEPTVVSSRDFIWAGGEHRMAQVGMQSRPLDLGSQGTAWFYANTGHATELRVDVVWHGSVRASVTVPALSGFAWRSLRITPPDQSALDDLSLRFVTTSGRDSNVRAAYFRLTTDNSASSAQVCDSGFGSFGVGRWPDACWRPYADWSPFNAPIPATARTAPNSGGMVSRLVGLGRPDSLLAGTADKREDWAHPTYYSQPTDPLYTLRCTAGWGTCALEGMQIRVPSAARAAGGGDGHMTIVDQAGGWEYSLWGVQAKPPGGGTLWFQWSHGRVRIDGSGINGGGTAAHFGNLAGIIRAQELAAGEIDHALFMVTRCDAGRYVYPAAGRGNKCANTYNALPMGARLQLNMTPSQIDELPVPVWKKTILRAMATYGMYFGDTGGGGAWEIQAESGSTYTSFGHPDQMVKVARDHGVPSHNGQYVFDIGDGVDWARYLRVIDPCTTQGTC